MRMLSSAKCDAYSPAEHPVRRFYEIQIDAVPSGAPRLFPVYDSIANGGLTPARIASSSYSTNCLPCGARYQAIRDLHLNAPIILDETLSTLSEFVKRINDAANSDSMARSSPRYWKSLQASHSWLACFVSLRRARPRRSAQIINCFVGLTYASPILICVRVCSTR